MAPSDSAITRPQEHASRGELANVSALAALAAMVVGYLMTFSIYTDTNYAVKFENGELPAGFDASSGQAAVVISLVLAVVAGILAGAGLACRRTKTASAVAGLLLLSAIPYVLLEFIAWQLAF